MFLGNTLGPKRNKQNDVYSLHVSFTADFFTSNRSKLKEKTSGVIVIPGNGQVQRSGDSAYAFRQDSNFWYLTGIQEPGIVLVISSTEEFIILPKRTAIQEVFDGSYDTNELQMVSGIEQILNYNAGWDKLEKLILDQKVYIPTVEEQNLSQDVYINYAKTKTLAKIIGTVGKENTKDISGQLTKLRMIKQQPEVEAIQKSIDITAKTFSKVMNNDWAKKYKNESDIAAEFNYMFSKEGAEHAYLPIIASGKNACTLHYIKNNQPVEQDKPLLIDAGAEKDMYAADITRVFASDKFTPQQKRIYNVVKNANEQAINMVKPGVTLKEIELATEKFLGSFLYSEKYIPSKDRKYIRKYYPHSVSHHLGLDVHDVADYTKPLEPGMVITIEPGLYIPEIGVGIRIEDDILVTEKGSKILSSSLPK